MGEVCTHRLSSSSCPRRRLPMQAQVERRRRSRPRHATFYMRSQMFARNVGEENVVGRNILLLSHSSNGWGQMPQGGGRPFAPPQLRAGCCPAKEKGLRRQETAHSAPKNNGGGCACCVGGGGETSDVECVHPPTNQGIRETKFSGRPINQNQNRCRP